MEKSELIEECWYCGVITTVRLVNIGDGKTRLMCTRCADWWTP